MSSRIPHHNTGSIACCWYHFLFRGNWIKTNHVIRKTQVVNIYSFIKPNHCLIEFKQLQLQQLYFTREGLHVQQFTSL